MLTESALQPQSGAVKPYLEHILAKVKIAAEVGKREITHPFSGVSGASGINIPYPTETIRTSVRKALETMGYNWTDHSDPDPGSPGSGSYTTVSW